MREEFEPELNLEWQYTKNTLKFKKSLYFQYNFGTDYLLCYLLLIGRQATARKSIQAKGAQASKKNMRCRFFL